MELRPLLVMGALAALVVANAYLVYSEEGLNRQEQQVDQIKNRDPLIDLVYAESNRRDNFAAFGMDDDMVMDALRQITDLQVSYEAKLEILLRDAAEPIEIAEALCGNTGDIRPRYGALEFLVEVDGDERRPIMLQQTSTLEKQDWSTVSPWRKVFEVAELGADRQDDATIMALGAIFLGEESTLIERDYPWGRSIAGGWSWKQVRRQNPRVSALVVKYLALMHLTVEIAQSDNGICGA